MNLRETGKQLKLTELNKRLIAEKERARWDELRNFTEEIKALAKNVAPPPSTALM